MTKSLYIAEKPSVAQQFAAALKKNWRRADGCLEADDAIVTWCVGHLVTMSYPEAYDPAYKRWSLQTLPFLPKEFKYQVIDSVAKQFNIVSGLLNRPDVDVIYICTDSGREGEYIYRLVDQMAGVKGKTRKRVWIDSQTEEEILRGIREAKDWTEYDNLSASAYLRAKEDYLMGINFSRLLTLKYGNSVSAFLKQDRTVVSVGRVMTCVLGMVVRREREIREFVKTPFYRVIGTFGKAAGPGQEEREAAGGSLPEFPCGQNAGDASLAFDAEWRCVEGSNYYGTPFLYKENGFKERKTAEELISYLTGAGALVSAGGCAVSGNAVPVDAASGNTASENKASVGGGISSGENELSGNSVVQKMENAVSAGQIVSASTDDGPKTQPEGRPKRPEHLTAMIASVERKKETKNPPLLYNLAELQNDCSKMFKISPDQTLQIVQELYEKKLVTYPRTDARVLSTAAAKEIHKNIGGLRQFAPLQAFAEEILQAGNYKNIAKTRYVNDKQITDHYAIVPTGQGFGALRSLKPLALKVYEVIARKFLSIFYPAAVYQKTSLELVRLEEHFFASFKILAEPGYLKVADVSGGRKRSGREDAPAGAGSAASSGADENAKKDAAEGADDSERNRRDLENPEFLKMLASLKKGIELEVSSFAIKEGETSPPKRYTSGSMILAMENAGQLIEDEELRAQIKGSGIGTSATRAEILKKLVNIKYLALNNKTQVITPTLLGELVYEVVAASIRQLLNPDLTASWEKGLTFVAGRTGNVMRLNNQYQLRDSFAAAARYYKK